MKSYKIFEAWFKSPVFVLIYRLSLMMIVYSLIRGIFYFMNRGLFPDIEGSQLLIMFLAGLRFDLTAVIYFNILYIVLMLLPLKARSHPRYIKYTDILFIVTNGLAIFINVADIIYFRFTNKRTSFMVFEEFANETNYFQLLYNFFLDYYYMLIIIVALIWGVIYFSNKIKPGKASLTSWKYYGVQIILFFVIITFSVIGVRGGLPPKQDFPLNPSDAGQYVNRPVDIAIVLNTPFTILLSSDKPVFPKKYYFKNEEELNAVYSPIHLADTTRKQNKLNVVIIMVESLGRETIGFFNKSIDNGNYKGYTPFLDSLCEHSLVYLNSYANSHISIEGTPAIAASIPSLQESYTMSMYSGNKINSLASCLNSVGYESWYFHAAPNGSLGLNSFANVAGFKHYVGKTEYNNDDDFDGVWGIWDHKFLPFSVRWLSDKKEPFLSYIFTTSSHHPYKIPEELDDKFEEGNVEIHRSIRYMDYGLKEFFATASKQSWYKNTIFVISGDHTCTPYYEQFKTAAGAFAVPIIFYKPESDLVGIKTNVAQQIDIMPTILNYLGYPYDYFAFGNDLFSENKNRFAVNYKSNVFQIIDDDWILQYDLEKTVGLYNLKTDKLMKKNLTGQSDSIQFDLEKKVKAFIQQYNNRMVEDRLLPN